MFLGGKEGKKIGARGLETLRMIGEGQRGGRLKGREKREQERGKEEGERLLPLFLLHGGFL